MQERAMYAAVVGQLIRRLRAGRRQAALAASAGLSQSALSRFENGQSLPDLYEARQLASALSRTHGEFVQLVDRAVARTRQVARQVEPRIDQDAIAADKLGAIAAIGVASMLAGTDVPASPKKRTRGPKG